MEIRNPHARQDLVNEAQDRLIAAKIRRNPRIIAFAKANLKRWMARDGRNVRPVFREWERALNWLTPAQMVAFLRSKNPMAQRMRQSSPFTGVLSEFEREEISRKYEKK